MSNVDGVEFEEVKLHLRSIMGRGFIGKIADVYKKIKAFGPDLLLLEGAGAFSLVPALIGKKFNVPSVVRIKGNVWQECSEMKYGISLFEKFVKFLNFRAGSWVMKHSLAIFPIADHLHPVIERNLGMKKPMYTVHITFNRPDDGEDVEGLDLRDEKFVLTVTSFDFWGKVEPLASAINGIAPVLLKEYGFTWVILGDGIFLDKFKMATKEAGNAVRLLGRKNPYNYYRHAKALFYISGMDGLPNVIMEASNFRLPIVMNDKCPAAEFIADRDNGLLVDFNDPEKIAAVLHRMVSDGNEFRALGDNACLYFRERFSVERVSEELRVALEKSIRAISA